MRAGGAAHRLLKSKVKLRLRSIKSKEPQIKPFDIQMLKDKELQQKYSIEIEKRFDVLKQFEKCDKHTETTWEIFENIITEDAKVTIGKLKAPVE
jgi:hypothetical protein